MHRRKVEALGLRAWPAREEIVSDGWRLRFSGGYTRRANSATPVEGAGRGIIGKIGACEAQYRKRELVPVFRLTSFSSQQVLDQALGERDYLLADPTTVMFRELSAGSPEPGIREISLEPWLDHYSKFSGASFAERKKHGAILSAITAGGKFVVLERENRTVACGLVVVESGYAGLFDLVVDPPCRRRGIGGELLAGLLALAAENCAAFTYLQVTEDNFSAKKMYRNAGFWELYRYWYRVPP